MHIQLSDGHVMTQEDNGQMKTRNPRESSFGSESIQVWVGALTNYSLHI